MNRSVKPSRPAGGALDFIRGNLFARSGMRPLAPEVAGPDNDLADFLDRYVKRAIADPSALVYAFGERWGPESGVRDKIFGFRPGNGVHDHAARPRRAEGRGRLLHGRAGARGGLDGHVLARFRSRAAAGG